MNQSISEPIRVRVTRGAQALECELPGELLAVLEARALEGGAAARVVGALKAMSRAGPHAERVRALLARSAVWGQYAAQRHDLFISAPAHHTIAGEALSLYLCLSRSLSLSLSVTSRSV